MNAFWYYPIYLLVFAAVIVLFEALRRRDVPWSIRAPLGGVVCAAMGFFMYQISDPPDFEMFSDLQIAYYPAGQAVYAENPAANLMATYKNGAEGFVNIPIMAYLCAPFMWVSKSTGEYAFLVLGVLTMIATWYALARLAKLNRDQSLLLLFLFAASGPLAYSLRIANSTHFVLLLFVLGIRALRTDRAYLAGAIFGFAALIKLPLMLLGIYFLLRGRWKVSMGGLALCAFASLLSLAVFGWDLHWYWYEHTIKPVSAHPLPAYNNQSIQGFFARLQYGNSWLLWWKPRPINPMVLLAAKMVVLCLVTAVTFVFAAPQRWRRGPMTTMPGQMITEIEIWMITLLAIMIGTISWSHYYLLLLLPAAFLIAGNPEALRTGWMRITGWAAIVGALLPVMTVKTGIPPRLSRPFSYFAVSHFLLSAALLLVILLIIRWRTRADETNPSQS
jgi:alpha-1,2-mannosyltransferase